MFWEDQRRLSYQSDLLMIKLENYTGVHAIRKIVREMIMIIDYVYS